MIKKLKVKNFKALRDIEIELTPIHVLIGPNDSGKTSILEVLAALCRSANHSITEIFLGQWKGTELVWKGESKLSVAIEVNFEDRMVKSYGVNFSFLWHNKKVELLSEFLNDSIEITNSKVIFHDRTAILGNAPSTDELQNLRNHVSKLLYEVHYYRFNPSFLALPVAPDSKRRFRMETNGFGLALLLDEILSFDRERFDKLENQFREIFSQIKSIKLQQEEAYKAPVDNPDQVTMLNRADGKGIYFQLRESGQLIPASQASDGTLLVLAYLSILYLPEPPRLLLIEEPENGIHPKRLQDILGVLKKLVKEQSRTQVVLTTHSPYVLDLFEPEEVTLCTKLDNGEIKTTRLSESSTVKKQLDVFTLGEIWTSEGDENIANSKEPTERTEG